MRHRSRDLRASRPGGAGSIGEHLIALLRLQRRAWAIAARAAVLPLTALVSRGERHLLWRLREECWGGRQSGLFPEVALSALMGRADVVRLFELPAEAYHLPEIRLLAVSALVARLRPAVAFEIGTGDGRTTRNMAANLDGSGHVFTLSLPLDQDRVHARFQAVPIGDRFLPTPEARRITQLWGDSRTFDFTPYLGRCQLIFIDADNSAEGVTADARTALRLVDRSGGVILWNNALRFGIRAVLPRLMRENGLPIHLIAESGLAILCFAGGSAAVPLDWAGRMRADDPGLHDDASPRL